MATERDIKDAAEFAAQQASGQNNGAGGAESAEAPQVFQVARPGSRRTFLQTLALGGATVAESCGGSQTSTPTNPTNPTTTSSSTTTSVASTRTFTLFGYVRDASGRGVVGAQVLIVKGVDIGKSQPTDGNGYFSIVEVHEGALTLRITQNGVIIREMDIPNFQGAQ